MTPNPASVDDFIVLSHLTSKAKAVLLDFDGPICSIFAGLAAKKVADLLRHEFDYLEDDTPLSVRRTVDPFDIFLHAATIGSKEAERVEAALTRLEVEAVETAASTTGAAQFIESLYRSGRPVSIVSNNSPASIRRFLAKQEVDKHIYSIHGRTSADPRLLKPSDYIIRQALQQTLTEPKDSILIGDSLTDVDAASSAGVPVIAYANSSRKVGLFRTSKAAAVVTRMDILVNCLKAENS